MTEVVPVRSGQTTFYVELSPQVGVQPVAIGDHLTFDGVRDTVAAIATELTEAWQRVKPTEASVEFGLKFTAKSGKLTGLVVEGGGEASMTVRLSWKSG